MVNVLSSLLVCGLVLVSAAQLKDGDVMQDYQRLKRLRPLGVKFAEHFRNASLPDLDLFHPRIPSQEDLLCFADIAQFMQALTAGKLWALKMIDAWGSIPSGELSGNAYHLGNFDECVKKGEEITSSHSIHGKYYFLIVPAVSISIKIASCFPASCSAAHMDTFLEQLMQNFLNSSSTNIKFSEASCQTSDRQLSQCSITARSSSRAIFRIIDSKSNPNVISCLDGIRCMSLFWMVLGHGVGYSAGNPNINTLRTVLIQGKLNAPILAVAILVYVNLITVVADGPLGYIEYRDKEACEKGCTNSSVQNQPSAVDGAGPALAVMAVSHLTFPVPVFSGSE
ncbi:GL14473 [Drosophila persimilis]|uniref:GL14473 n=1 Tax=Drosophila persimilis TaxID=7234 RepID=B4HD73_DROPE|nr:GL14473 [Drosophila persimilis]